MKTAVKECINYYNLYGTWPILVFMLYRFNFVSAYLTIEKKSYIGKITAERFIYFTYASVVSCPRIKPDILT